MITVILFTERTRLRRKIPAVNITAHMFKIVLCFIPPFTRYFVLIDQNVLLTKEIARIYIYVMSLLSSLQNYQPTFPIQKFLPLSECLCGVSEFC